MLLLILLSLTSSFRFFSGLCDRQVLRHLEEATVVLVQPVGCVGTRLVQSGVPAADGTYVPVWTDRDDGYLAGGQAAQPLVGAADAAGVLLRDVIQVQRPAAFSQQRRQVGELKLGLGLRC